MSDTDLIFDYLSTRPGFHNAVDMMRYLKPNAVNWALRSRISDLNKKFAARQMPYRIESRIGANGCAEYRLESVVMHEPEFFDDGAQRCFA